MRAEAHLLAPTDNPQMGMLFPILVQRGQTTHGNQRRKKERVKNMNQRKREKEKKRLNVL
jgi:hypothetical protein